MSITSGELPQEAAIQINNLPDNRTDVDKVPNNPPPLLRRLDKINSSGDIGVDIIPSKSANSGFPRPMRNLLLTHDKRSYSSGFVENTNKQRVPPGLLPQEVTTPVKGTSPSRQIDGVRFPPVVSADNISHDPNTKVNSLPGMYTRRNSAKNIPEILSRPPSSVSRLPDGAKSVIRNPPSMFGSSPVVVNKGAQHVVANSPPQYSSSPPLHNFPHGKPITSNTHQLHRELSAVKSDTSLSQFNNAEQRKFEAKSPGSINESSPSDHESTMTAMLMPQLLPLRKHGSANDSGADTVELYSSSSASDGEMFGHQKGMPKGKKVLTNKPTPQILLKGKPPKRVANGNINFPDTGESDARKDSSLPKGMSRNKGMSKVASTALDEMRAEQAKLQNQLNEFVKKQADYEEALKVAKRQSAEVQENMTQELKLLKDEKKKTEQNLKSSHEKEKQLQFSAEQQLTKSQETEVKLKAEIDALKSELAKQSAQLQQNQEVMEMLQKHIKLPPITTTTATNIAGSNSSINSTPQSKPSVIKSSPQVKLKGRRQSTSTTSSDKSMTSTKSKFCSIM